MSIQVCVTSLVEYLKVPLVDLHYSSYYMNNLPIASNLFTRLFADDTSLTLSNTDVRKLEEEVNTELKKVNNWMCLNKLSLNFNKTEFLLIIKKKLKFNFKNLNSSVDSTKKKQQVKYLGIIIDDSLSWKPHIKRMCSKISRGSFAIFKLRKLVNLNILKCAYYAL